MFKYVLKRLGLSVIVLLGVSVIIYFLVRLMPTNYLETKFSAQIQQGTITLEQLDDFQKRYGLYMPEAYVSVDIDGYDTFEKDAKEKKYQDAQNEIITYAEFYAGKYTNKKDFVLELNKEGTYRIYKQDGDTVTEEKSGIFTAALDSITFRGKTVDDDQKVDAIYTTANVWDKFVAVLGGYFHGLAIC